VNVQFLATAVRHWLEFERRCDRTHLMSEALLKVPIGQFLAGTTKHTLVPEEPYPQAMQPLGRGRRKSADFCVKRVGGTQVWRVLIESKWVNGKRSYIQELFDDLLRLEIVRRPSQAEPFTRFLLIAGAHQHLQAEVFAKTLKDGGVPVTIFSTIFPQTIGTSRNVRVGDAGAPHDGYWRKAANSCRSTSLPLSMTVKLAGKATRVDAGDAQESECWIWRVSSTSKRATRDLK